MEGVPDFESLEAMPQPDLLEAFADREVTIFGVTGTFKDLADMCPVDLHDPRVSLEAKNEFVVKAANEAGLEIEPEHEKLFARVTEQLGLERKFTVATFDTKAPERKADPGNHVHREEPAKAEATRERREEQNLTSKPVAETAAANNRTEVPRQPQPVTAEDSMTMLGELPGITNETPPSAERLGGPIVLPEPVLSETHDAVVQDQLMRLQEFLQHDGDAEPGNQRRQTARTETGDTPASGYDAAIEESAGPAFDIEALLAEIETEAAPAPETIDTLFAPARVEGTAKETGELSTFVNLENESDSRHRELSAQSGSEVVIATIEWEDELHKEPLDIYEDFAEALRSFAELPTVRTTAEGDEASLIGQQPNANDTKTEFVEAPPILTAVSERLAELQPDEKELVAPVLKDIVGAMHGIQLLEAQAADPEMVESVEAQLQTLCMSLFETIGVEYDEHDVKQFVRILLHQEFRPPQPDPQTILDIEHMGTHEVKRHFSYLLTNGLIDVEYELEQLLGMFALLRAPIGTNRELALAA